MSPGGGNWRSSETAPICRDKAEAALITCAARAGMTRIRLGSRNADRCHHSSGAIANRCSGYTSAHAYLFFFIVDSVAQSLHIFAGKPQSATRGYRVLVVPHEPLLADQFIEHV